MFLSPLDNIIPFIIVLITRLTILFTAKIKNIALTIPFNLVFSKNIKQIKEKITPPKVVTMTMKLPPISVTLPNLFTSDSELILLSISISLNKVHLYTKLG